MFEIAPNQQLKAVELSETEMKETEGEFIWVVPHLVKGTAGGFMGLAGYEASCMKHNDCDPKAEAGAFWGGFAAGVVHSGLSPFVGAYVGSEMSRW